MSLKALQDYTLYSKYAKYIPEKKRRENWREQVDRVFDMHAEKLHHLMNNEDFVKEFNFAKEMMFKKRVLGSQRALQFGGEAILRHNQKIYNCAASHIDRLRAFQEVFFMLLCGCGVGFSVQKQHIAKLPKIQKRTGPKKYFVIPDSIEGWADSIGVLLSSYCLNKEDCVFPEYWNSIVDFDYTQIRPKGAPISWGGKAPGPSGLMIAIKKCEKLMERIITSERDSIKPIEAYDLLMHVSDACLSGGHRRSATICMFSKDDEEMTNAKTGNWFMENPQRARSNNSVTLLKSDVTRDFFMNIMQSVKQYGEPGFIFVDDLDTTYNPCSEVAMLPKRKEDGLSGFQMCNLSEINMKKVKTEEDFYDSCRAGAILGTIQASYNSFPYLGKVTEDIVNHEALIGVSMTGMMDTPDIAFNPEIQRKGAEIVKETNKYMAKIIGVNQAARTTVVKPAGTTSCICGSSSGIHPSHSRRYFRRVQANKMEFPAKYFKSINPRAVEESVWSSNNTDYVINFLCEVPAGSITKNQTSALELLEKVKLTQMNWVEYGTNEDLCVNPKLRHNVSNTITVKPEEWDDVANFIYENKKYFAGISLLPSSGDKDYQQAPFTSVLTPQEILNTYGDGSLFASGLIVDAQHAYNKNLWAACDSALGLGEPIDINMLKNKISFEISLKNGKEQYWNELNLNENSSDEELEKWLIKNIDNYLNKKEILRRMKQFAERYFEGDIRNMTYCLKDVYNWKLWCDLKREYVEIDWSNVVEEDEYLMDVSKNAGDACSGGKCDIIYS